MKLKYIFYSLLIVLVSSCAVSNETRSFRKTLNGNWQLETIVSEGITGKVTTLVFNEAQFDCFIGSQWQFTNASSLGTYSISPNGSECAAVKRNFRWAVYEAKDQPKLLQFKRLDDKLTEIDANSGGFRFIIKQLNADRLSLRSDLSHEGKPAAFIYNFKKM